LTIFKLVFLATAAEAAAARANTGPKRSGPDTKHVSNAVNTHEPAAESRIVPSTMLSTEDSASDIKPKPHA